MRNRNRNRNRNKYRNRNRNTYPDTVRVDDTYAETYGESIVSMFRDNAGYIGAFMLFMGVVTIANSTLPHPLWGIIIVGAIAVSYRSVTHGADISGSLLIVLALYVVGTALNTVLNAMEIPGMGQLFAYAIGCIVAGLAMRV
jgi:hypothetical protein